jgi:hypothetical protein
MGEVRGDDQPAEQREDLAERPSRWFVDEQGRYDYAWSTEGHLRQGWLGLEHGGQLVKMPIAVRTVSAGVMVQLSEATANLLTEGVRMDLFIRRRGMGRVRKDLSLPMEPPVDHAWVQGSNDNAVLVMRRREGDRVEDFAAFHLGPMEGEPGPSMAVLLFVTDEDFLRSHRR